MYLTLAGIQLSLPDDRLAPGTNGGRYDVERLRVARWSRMVFPQRLKQGEKLRVEAEARMREKARVRAEQQALIKQQNAERRGRVQVVGMH